MNVEQFQTKAVEILTKREAYIKQFTAHKILYEAAIALGDNKVADNERDHCHALLDLELDMLGEVKQLAKQVRL